MGEDDGNPYASSSNLRSLKVKEKAWEEGRQYEQDNPSPQTIKRIQSNFAEEVKEILHELAEKYDAENPRERYGENAYLYKAGLGDLEKALDKLLQHQGGD
jgi:NTP pyrophosphatase (non-canonical NTP hydrolase)